MKEFITEKCEKAFSPVPNWVQRLATITMGAKLTYGRLLQCANDEGVAWPSQRFLARHGLEERRQAGRIEAGFRQRADADAVGFMLVRAGEVDALLQGHSLAGHERALHHLAASPQQAAHQ